LNSLVKYAKLGGAEINDNIDVKVNLSYFYFLRWRRII
jgi:hypothetical protein